ncbi:MAG: cupin domain-containing protein [Chloroflexi bacterium]|nr:cupin domain-containing protein [Chloroflexota bacterium]
MDIRRFGPGHRRPEGPPGTTGLTGQVLWSDPSGHVSELAFSRQGMIAPHVNPHTTLFVVVSGGGWVQVGDERSRINHGEAVVWPAGVAHGAWTDGTEMRAIVVELPDRPDEPASVVEGSAVETTTPDVEPARGTLAERLPDPGARDETTGEPW